VRPIVLVALLSTLLVACNSSAEAPSEDDQSTAEQDAEFVRMATAGKLQSDLQSYLASDAPAPRTLTFDRLAFAPGSSTVQPIDQPTIYGLANVLQNHPEVRIRVLGYADPYRDGADHESLPLRRASSIAAALEAAGVAPSPD
jgi:outer membrane protein OmpA-like peptidoglycan-associated protein